jgi:twitching motility protein PilT
MEIRELLQFMVQQNISDIHFKANCAPLIRLHGRLITAHQDLFSPDIVKNLAYSLMNDQHKKRFEQEGELDMSYTLDKISRFRVNIYRQKGTIAVTLRVIPLDLKTFEQLNLPSTALQNFCAAPSGLILLAGVTGAGKTTTMNSMVNYINENYAYNIITVEDPIEFYHTDKKSSVSQREVGNDTQSFHTALRFILRQDPDVIVIGEMRDPETIAAAITAAETGHLVLSTIHTADALHTLQRIIDSYPGDQQPQIRTTLANVLRGVMAQKLLPTIDDKSQIPCTEVLTINSYLRQLIMEGKTSDLYAAMARSQAEGALTFDQDLLRLCKAGKITRETALTEAARPENFLSLLQGITVRA